MIAVSDATSPPHPSAVGVHLLLADCCLHANWATLRRATPAGPLCTKDWGVAGPLLALPLLLYVTWAKLFVLFTSQIRRKRLMLVCSGRRLWTLLSSGWTVYVHSGKVQNSRLGILFPKALLKAEHERSVLSEGHSLSASCSCPPREFVCGSAQEGCRAVVASSPWDNPERKLSASTPMHWWQVQQVS